MKRPISTGDKCLVVGGLGLDRSPNLGLTVTVRSLQGDHSVRGRIWRCEGEGVMQFTDTGTYQLTGWADFAASWLQRIEPDTKAKTKEKHYETTD